jgi:hypothetical protein
VHVVYALLELLGRLAERAGQLGKSRRPEDEETDYEDDE